MLRTDGRVSRTCWMAAAIQSVTTHAETKQMTSPYEKSLCQFILVPSIAPSLSILYEEYPPKIAHWHVSSSERAYTFLVTP